MGKSGYASLTKWLAGIVMMGAVCFGIVFGFYVCVAVERGGYQVIQDGTAPVYEESYECIRALVYDSINVLEMRLTKMLYEQEGVASENAAMTIIPADTWLQMHQADKTAWQQGETGEVQTEPEDELQRLQELTRTGPQATVEEETGIRTYTYQALQDWRQRVVLTEAEGARADFFSDSYTNEDVETGNQYVELDASVVAAYVKAYANAEEDGTYTLEVGDTIWTYNEQYGQLMCDRIGNTELEGTFYYHLQSLEQAHNKLMDKENAMQVFLTQPLCYFNGLVMHYTEMIDTYESVTSEVAARDKEAVNYRYSLELKAEDEDEGAGYRNTEDEFFNEVEAYAAYDYQTGKMTGPLASDRWYTCLLDACERTILLPSGAQVNLGTYLENNAKSLVIGYAKTWSATDDLYSGKQRYEQFQYLYHDARKNLTLTIVFFVMALLSMGYLVLVVGYQDAAGTPAAPLLTFRIPSEFILLLSCSLCTLIGCAYEGLKSADSQAGDKYSMTLAIAVCIGMVWATIPFAFELLSRVRHRLFWRNSISARILHFFVRKPLVWCKGKWQEMVQAVRIDRRLCLCFVCSRVLVLFLTMIAVLFGCNQEGMGMLLFLLFAFALEAGIWIRSFRDITDTYEIMKGVERQQDGDLDYQIPTADMKGHKKQLAEAVNHLQEGRKLAVETSLKDERLKTELITNVSHDIKTPLTSIINYVDLLKKEPYPSEPAKHYLEVLDQKSQRLKQLMEDLVEVSKSATGNVEFHPMQLDLIELLRQTTGEFEDKFAQRQLELVENVKVDEALVNLDSRHTFRIFENLCQNIFKYAMEGSRVYIDIDKREERIQIVLKNISRDPLNISADELMERFVRGDASRNTSGSGLGLSIAKNLATLQQGTFDIVLDGDLFKAVVTFPCAAMQNPDCF